MTTGDPYAATWISHSSINDFLKCPRAYYLKNMYKDPKSGHKIQMMTPPLALGQAVHEVLDSLSTLPTKERFSQPLVEKFDIVWKKFEGKRGGFSSIESEQVFKNRGIEMLKRVYNHPGPLLNLAVKIKDELPQYWISPAENIILCGKIDWLEYLPDTDSVHIIDFKTSRFEEDESSLQFSIYHLLVHNCQKRKVSKVSYWYLGLSDTPIEKNLPDLQESHDKIINIARQIKAARKLDRLNCPTLNGCSVCKPYEKIVKREAEFVGTNDYNQDIYIIDLVESSAEDEESYIL